MTNITGGIKATNVASFLVNWKKFVLRIQWFRQSNKIWSWLINICPSPAIYMRLVKRIMNNHQLFLLKSFAEFHRGHFMNKKKYRHVQEDYIKIPLTLFGTGLKIYVKWRGGGCLPPPPSKHPKSLWKTQKFFFAFQIGHIEIGKVTKFGVICRPFWGS